MCPSNPLTSENIMTFVKNFLMVTVCFVFLLSANEGFSASAASPAVQFETTMGNIIVRLDAAKAPVTVENFLNYVKSGHYDGTIFHRVISNFMIQGGGMTEDMKEKPTEKPIKIESSNGLSNDKYTLAMARTSDPNSATSQFFINVKDNKFLNFKAPTHEGYGYTVFGKVIKGEDVVEKIKTVPTGSRGRHSDVPKTPVIITKAFVIE